MAPLLRAALDCERMSHEVSLRQSRLAPAPLSAALRAQSRQETLHAGLFDAALKFVPRAGGCPAGLQRKISDYGRRLHADLDAGALASSLIGLQCVFEGLAAVALEPPDGELVIMSERFLPLNALVRRQELAHHQLGTLWLPRLVRQGSGSLAQAWTDYVELAEGLVEAALAVFDGSTQDRKDYVQRARVRLEGLQDLAQSTARPSEAIVRDREMTQFPAIRAGG